MAVARVFAVNAHHARADDVRAETRKLLGHLAQQKGFIEGWYLGFQAQPDLVVRFTMWQDRPSADQAANTYDTMAMISKIRSMSDETTAPEGVYDAEIIQHAGHEGDH